MNTRTRTLVFTALAMIAFAGNSLLCRLALKHTQIDPATFTSVRLISGALMLWMITAMRSSKIAGAGNWISGFALFAYAAAFSFAYITLPAGTGALLLFGSVQATMIAVGLLRGERLRSVQTVGFLLALGGLGMLLLPGISAPSLPGSTFMIAAGIAWGAYSLRGKRVGDPTLTTAQNFLRAVPFAIVLSIVMLATAIWDSAGIGYAVCSGALTSGIGYSIWYSALPDLKATHAAAVQLSVPVLAAIGGVALLAEDVSTRLLVTSIAIIGGIAMVIFDKRHIR